jgi:catechol 2,3-dioxygenase-like lactoylglutathione lyase family enzyme
MIRGIHHVAVHVHDLDRMAAFYKSAFGFEPANAEFAWSGTADIDRLIGVPGSAARTVMLRAGNCFFELFEFSAPAPRSARPLAPYDKGYTHFCVEVTNISQEFARLSSLGMVFAHRAPIDAGDLTAIYGRDPEGNIIEIMQTTPTHAYALNNLPPAA